MERMEVEKPILDRREPIPGEYGHPLPRELMLRELGYNGQFGRHSVGKKFVSQTFSTKAVHTMSTQEEFKKRSFKLPNGARTTFHMAFSADGTKVASCHGDHNVYVCEVGSGKVVQTLTGHPRTPWCVVFHPTQNDVLASGCLAGQVRVWDLKGGSETLITDSGTVIASLAFHPIVRLLAIATFNEIIFWDWGLPYPLARCSTENTKEKVRLVRFDRLGRSLITGITNYPNPPFRESCRVQGSAFFRPNILSRGGSSRTLRRPPRYPEDPTDNPGDDDPGDGSGPRPDENMAMSAAMATEGPVTDTLNIRQERFQQSYRQLVNHYQDLVNHYQQFLRSRIPRLLETSRVVRQHNSSLFQPRSTFVPVEVEEGPASVLSTLSSPDGSNDALNMDTSDPLSPDQPEYPVVGSPEQLPNGIVIDQETPGPSRLVQLENTILEHMETEAAATLANLPNLMANPLTAPAPTSSTSQGLSTPGRSGMPRRDTDLQSIEALAQNILEMQNLCTQARRDAPLTVETQHIIELQNIRQHLELLQEQTRDLQSSIRATLTSLAHGSFDALRSQIINNVVAAGGGVGPRNIENSTTSNASVASSVPGNALTPAPPPPSAAEPPEELAMMFQRNPLLRTADLGGTPAPQNPPPPIPPNPNPPMTTTSNHNVSVNVAPSSAGGPLNPVIRITISPHIATASHPVELGRLSPPGPYLYSNSPPPSRARVPPIVTMQYDFGDVYRSRTTASLNPGINMEPLPGPSSRDMPSTSTTYQVARSTIDPVTGSRRVIREFHVMGRPGENDHARNCPFGRDGPLTRPPPRMRCLTEMGEIPMLAVWPTNETGQERAIRSFQGLRRPILDEEGDSNGSQVERFGASSSNSMNANASSTASAASNNNGESPQLYHMHPLYTTAHLPSFSHWMNSGPFWVNSDVGVGVYLSVRQHNEAAHSAIEGGAAELSNSSSSEEWQRHFVSGLGLVPPAVREGHRHHSRRLRRTPNIIYHMGNGSSRAVPLRPSSWDEFRSNLYTSSSPTELGSLSPNSPYLAGINLAREVPGTLDGNFNRIYGMRVGEEIVPVYSHWQMTPQQTGTGTQPPPLELRESPQANVYTFPIGLFLEGSFWTNGTQSVGIFWPPASREEEDLLIEFRRNETLVPVLTQEEMEVRGLENRSHGPYRIDYDEASLVIHVSDVLWLRLIQPGLALLDGTTTILHWQRPRPVSGTVYVNNLAPFLDGLERLFGHRMRRTVLSNGATAAGAATSGSTAYINTGGVNNVRLSNLGPSGPYIRQAVRTAHGLQGRQARGEANIEPGTEGNLADAPPTVRRREGRANHPRRFISFANEPPNYQNNILSRYPGETLDAYRRRLYNDYLGQDAPEPSAAAANPAVAGGETQPQPTTSSSPMTHYVTVSRSRMGLGRMTRSEAEQRFSEYMNEQETTESDRHNRRFIRLAVDTATAEVLRRQYDSRQHGGSVMSNPAVQSAIESRIERVLNERGNRGVAASISPTNFTPEPSSGSSSATPTVATTGASSRPRQEELQMRINVLTQWSRHRAAMSTSGTQTPRSFLRNGTEVATPTAVDGEIPRPPPSGSTPPTTTPAGPPEDNIVPARHQNRRRPYSRLSRSEDGGDNNSDEESTPPLPPRIARMGAVVGMGEYTVQSVPAPTSNEPNEEGDPPLAGSGYATNRVESQFMPFGEHWVIRRQRHSNQPAPAPRSVGQNQIGFATRRVENPGVGGGVAADLALNPNNALPVYDMNETSARTRVITSAANSSINSGAEPGPGTEEENPPSTSGGSTHNPRQIPSLRRNIFVNEEIPLQQNDASARFYPGYIPEILITPRARPPTYYTMDAATTAFLSSRIQKWDFSKFILPDITKRDESVVVRECSLHSDACLDVSSDSDFLAVLQPSDNGQYSAVGLYSLREESLGGILYIYHFDQNTVSVSISPSCDYIVVGYAGRGPFYRFVHPSRNIGQILSLTRDGERMKLVSVKELFADSQSSLMSINCMHWVPVPGYGIIYGTNTGELVLLS